MDEEPRLKISRRRLPHWTLPNSIYFVTFRTAGSELAHSERQIVYDQVLTGSGPFYRLFASVVMPDHIHLVIQPNAEISLSRIMKGTKGASARRINVLRKHTGHVWQDESFDRIIRDDDEFMQKLEYIESNPVKAGLATSSTAYPYLFLEASLDQADRNVCPTEKPSSSQENRIN